MGDRAPTRFLLPCAAELLQHVGQVAMARILKRAEVVRGLHQVAELLGYTVAERVRGLLIVRRQGLLARHFRVQVVHVLYVRLRQHPCTRSRQWEGRGKRGDVMGVGMPRGVT